MSDVTVPRSLRVRKVHSLRTFLWLRLGWRDFTASPGVGLAHGAVMGVFGALMLALAWDRFWVLAGALSGFLLVAPILSTGLYAVSRALLRGSRPALLPSGGCGRRWTAGWCALACC